MSVNRFEPSGKQFLPGRFFVCKRTSHRCIAVSKCALPEKRLPPWVGKLREAVMRGIARRSRISFRQEYRVRKDISCRQAYRLREAQQKRYSADAERYACLRKHDMFAFANTICGVMPAQIENHPLENPSSAPFPPTKLFFLIHRRKRSMATRGKRATAPM